MQKQSRLKIGSDIIPFKLKSTENSEVSPADFSDKKALVVMFTCNHCPYVQAYEERMISLQKEFSSEGVQFIAINANEEVNYPEDSFEHMVTRAKEKGFNFPYLRDESQEIAAAYGAQRTPEVFLFNESQKLVYTGRIDDNWQDSGSVQVQDLHDAIQATLTGKAIKFSETAPVGCSIKWKKT